MNVNRLIWITTTVLFAVIGFLTGLSLGQLYLALLVPGLKAPMHWLIIATLAVATSILLARLGSWLANRFLINSLNRMQEVSAVDRVLGIVGVLLGLLFGALISFTLPGDPLWLPIKLCVMAVCAIFGMALLQGMREEMLNVFPQLETASSSGSHCSAKILDTNIIIDGRMADICKTGFIEGPLYVPSFVLDEVQYIADSADALKRARGRRGLDVLNSMRELMTPNPANPEHPEPIMQVMHDFPASVRKIPTVDSKLVALAKELKAAIVTNDFNLNRVAALQGVQVLNINELVGALRPVVLPGEEMTIMISREGKEAGQGIGYLDDGTMVVISDGRRHIGQTCKIIIGSLIQTAAGKMIFAEMKAEARSETRENSGPKGSGDDLFDDDNGNQRPSSGYGDDGGNRSRGGVRRPYRT